MAEGADRHAAMLRPAPVGRRPLSCSRIGCTLLRGLGATVPVSFNLRGLSTCGNSLQPPSRCARRCVFTGGASASTPGGDVRLTNDTAAGGGYVSAYTLATGNAYTDATLDECSRLARPPERAVPGHRPSRHRGDDRQLQRLLRRLQRRRGRQRRPDPVRPDLARLLPLRERRRRLLELAGSRLSRATPPRSAALANIRTASAGDPVIAWDADGRVFMGSETRDDPAGTKKTFGDEWVATLRQPRRRRRQHHQRRQALRRLRDRRQGLVRAEPARQVQRQDRDRGRPHGGTCDGNVYFAWSRFTGNGARIYFVRSTDHGATFRTPMKLTHERQRRPAPGDHRHRQRPRLRDLRTVRGRRRQGDAVASSSRPTAARPSAQPKQLVNFTPWEEPTLDSAAAATRLRRRISALPVGLHVLPRRHRPASPRRPGRRRPRVRLHRSTTPPSRARRSPTGTTLRLAVGSGAGGQSARLLRPLQRRHRRPHGAGLMSAVRSATSSIPDLAVDDGTLHVLWWDSRNDPTLLAAPPARSATTRTATSAPRSTSTRARSNVRRHVDHAGEAHRLRSNGNYEQFATARCRSAATTCGSTRGMASPSASGPTGGTPSPAPTSREPGTRTTAPTSAVPPRSTPRRSTADTCPRAGGLDQDIYGDLSP